MTRNTTSSSVPLEELLPLSLLDSERFLSLFYDPIKLQIERKTVLHLHMLQINSGEFIINELFKELSNHSLSFVLSRRNLRKALADRSRIVEFVNKVQSQFKAPDPNAGEGGELLLYSFLESHLGAPKILSKMELKTSSEHYVHGSDGVHLLQVEVDNYQMIFGESKMYGDVVNQVGSSTKRAIKAAFKSMGEVQEQSFDFDTWLVESELLKESLDENAVDVLAEILLPGTKSKRGQRTSNAFGVFIGYELDVTELQFSAMTSQQIESELRRRALDCIERERETIKKEIKDRGLGGYHFHMYAVPFLKKNVNGNIRGIEQVRMELARVLRGGQLTDEERVAE